MKKKLCQKKTSGQKQSNCIQIHSLCRNILNCACKRHYLVYSVVTYHNKSSCEISALLVEDFLRKGEKSEKKHINYV